MQYGEMMEQKEENTYYIVCKSISYKKNLDKTEINAIFQAVANAFPKAGYIPFFIKKEDAILCTSELQALEVPKSLKHTDKKTHTYAKPILCFSLDHPLALRNVLDYSFGGKGMWLRVRSYQVAVTDLPPLSELKWNLLLDGQVLSASNNIQVNKDAPSENAYFRI
jgi:hypothetical protein